MTIIGLRHTANFGDNERPEDWAHGILLNEPNGDTPLFALTSVMRSEKVTDPHYHWFEKKLASRRLELSSPISNSATNLGIVKEAKSVVKNTVLRSINTGEIFVVTVDPTSDTSITVERAFAGTTAAATIAKDPFLYVIGTVYEEGSVSPSGQGYDPITRTNYTQIFRRSLEQTGTAINTDLRTGSSVIEAKREALQYYSADVEKAFFFGKKSLGFHNNKPRRTFDGVWEVIKDIAPQNIIEANTAYPNGVSYDDLERFMMEIFRYGSKEKMGFCGNRFLLTIQQIIRLAAHTTWEIDSKTKEYGMNVSKIITPFGTLVLKMHPLFSQDTSDLSRDILALDSWCFILDMAKVKKVYLQNRDTKYQKVSQDNGLDGEKSEYLGEISIKIEQGENHALIKNLVKAAPSETLTSALKEATTTTVTP